MTMINFIIDLAAIVFFCFATAIYILIGDIQSVIRSMHISIVFFYVVLIVVPALTLWYELQHKNDLFDESDYEL